MNCAIIGYGSIGKRHYKILKKNKFFKNIYVVSKTGNNRNFFKNISDILDKQIEYFVISNETKDHYKTFRVIEKNFSGKKILIEKPAFHKSITLNKKLKNVYYVGYNLRFNPAVNYAKKIIKNKKIFYMDMHCKTFMPNWRKNRDYTQIYSSFKKKGGGVLNDLSHELDLMYYFFGDYKLYSGFSKKISNLKIDSDDVSFFFGRFKKKIFFNVNLNFFSRIESRKFIIASNDLHVEVDLIRNRLIISKKNLKKFINLKNVRNNDYLEMHKNILFKKGSNACSLKVANLTMKKIESIKNL